MLIVMGCYYKIVRVVSVTIAKVESFHFDDFDLNFLTRSQSINCSACPSLELKNLTFLGCKNELSATAEMWL